MEDQEEEKEEEKLGDEGVYCPNALCPNTDKMLLDSYCEICGAKSAKLSYMEFSRIMGEKKKIQLLQERLRRGDATLLIGDEKTDDNITAEMKKELVDLALLETQNALFSRATSSISKSITDQLLGLGFRFLIMQNKVIIRQNELILRNLRRLNDLSDRDAETT